MKVGANRAVGSWILLAVAWIALTLVVDAGHWARRHAHERIDWGMPTLAMVVCGGAAALCVAEMHGMDSRWRRVHAMTAAALALTGVGLAGFVACSAAYGFVGARHSHAYLQVFDVAFKAWGLAALFLPVPACGAIVLASRGEPWRAFLVAPLLWVAGGVTVWNLGLAFVLV